MFFFSEVGYQALVSGDAQGFCTGDDGAALSHIRQNVGATHGGAYGVEERASVESTRDEGSLGTSVGTGIGASVGRGFLGTSAGTSVGDERRHERRRRA